MQIQNASLKSRRGKRRAHDALRTPQTVACPIVRNTHCSIASVLMRLFTRVGK